MAVPSLLTPCRVGPVTLANRVVLAPMTTLLETAGGEAFERFYLARAAGGVAMVVLNLQALWPGRGGPATGTPLLALNHDVHLPRLRSLVDGLHRHGSVACAQLATGPRWSPDGPDGPGVALTPSGVTPAGEGFRRAAARMPFFTGGPPAPADVLDRLPGAVAAAARRAVEAGFDAIQVAAGGGNILAQYLSPRLNQRTDAFGGTLAGRARLTLATLRAVRAAIGPGVALTCRVNGDDLVPGGMTAADYAGLVPVLEDAGAQAIDVMPGGLISAEPVNQPNVPPGRFFPISATLRGAARVPVAAGTRVVTPDVAGRALATGAADLVTLGTPLIADADWVKKLQEGREDSIRLCTACEGCWNDLLERRRPIGCPENPAVGRE